MKFSDIEVTNKTTFRSVYNARRINNEKNEKKKKKIKKYLKKKQIDKGKGKPKTEKNIECNDIKRELFDERGCRLE